MPHPVVVRSSHGWLHIKLGRPAPVPPRRSCPVDEVYQTLLFPGLLTDRSGFDFAFLAEPFFILVRNACVRKQLQQAKLQELAVCKDSSDSAPVKEPEGLSDSCPKPLAPGSVVPPSRGLSAAHR